jgi:hypothetical protein
LRSATPEPEALDALGDEFLRTLGSLLEFAQVTT